MASARIAFAIREVLAIGGGLRGKDRGKPVILLGAGAGFPIVYSGVHARTPPHGRSVPVPLRCGLAHGRPAPGRLVRAGGGGRRTTAGGPAVPHLSVDEGRPR